MFTCRVILGIKADPSAEFTRIVDGKTLPQLRVRKGRRHEGSFNTPLLSGAVINSYRDAQEYAEAYEAKACPDGLKALADGAPRVETFPL